MRSRRKRSRLPALPIELKTALKWILYTAMGVAAYIMALSGRQSQVIFMIPLAVAIAVFEEEIPSALMGGFLGLLTDLSADKLLGFTACYLCIICGGVSALFRQLMRKNVFNFGWVYLLAGGIYLYIDYYLFYKIWQLEGYEQVLRSVLLPSALKTYLWGFLSYVTVSVACRVFGESRRLRIEEQSSMVDRL